MASWFDLLAFTLTLAAFVGAIIAAKFITNQISSTVASTKESLKSRGLAISDKGVSVQTSSRLGRSREDYVDATQRGFIKAMNAATFSTAKTVEATEGSSNSSSRDRLSSLSHNISVPKLGRVNSSGSVLSTGSGNGAGSISDGKSHSEKENGKGKKRFSLKKRNSES